MLMVKCTAKHWAADRVLSLGTGGGRSSCVLLYLVVDFVLTAMLSLERYLNVLYWNGFFLNVLFLNILLHTETKYLNVLSLSGLYLTARFLNLASILQTETDPAAPGSYLTAELYLNVHFLLGCCWTVPFLHECFLNVLNMTFLYLLSLLQRETKSAASCSYCYAVPFLRLLLKAAKNNERKRICLVVSRKATGSCTKTFSVAALVSSEIHRKNTNLPCGLPKDDKQLHYQRTASWPNWRKPNSCCSCSFESCQDAHRSQRHSAAACSKQFGRKPTNLQPRLQTFCREVDA